MRYIPPCDKSPLGLTNNIIQHQFQSRTEELRYAFVKSVTARDGSESPGVEG